MYRLVENLIDEHRNSFDGQQQSPQDKMEEQNMSDIHLKGKDKNEEVRGKNFVKGSRLASTGRSGLSGKVGYGWLIN